MSSFSTWNTSCLVVDGVEIGIHMSIFLALDDNHCLVEGKMVIKMMSWNFITKQSRFCNPDAILLSIREAEEETNQLVTCFSKHHFIDQASYLKRMGYQILQTHLNKNQHKIVYV